MAKKVLRETKLRQVNVETTTAPLSQSVSTTFDPLQVIESFQAIHGTKVASPVMKSLGVSVFSQRPAGYVDDGDIEGAYSEVGIKCSTRSSKREKRRAECMGKRSQQISLYNLHHEYEVREQQFDTFEEQLDNKAALEELEKKAAEREANGQPKLTDQEKDAIKSAARQSSSVEREKKKREAAYHFFEHQDSDLKHIIPENMESLYSMLTQKDSYKRIKSVISQVSYFEEEILRLLNDPQVAADQTRVQGLRKSQARLMVLKDFSAHVSIVESLMMNEYYSYLPLDEVKSVSYDELKKRLDDEYARPEQAQAGPGEKYRNVKLIDYYQNLIRLKMIGFENGATVKGKTAVYERALEKQAERRSAANPAAANPAPNPGPVDGHEKKAMLSNTKMIVRDYEALKKFAQGDGALLDPEGYKAQFFRTYKRQLDEFKSRYPQQEWPDDIVQLIQDYDNQAAPPVDKVKKKIWSDHPKTEVTLSVQDDSLHGITLTDEQKKGVEDIDAFILRKSLSEKSRRAFAFNCLKVSPEQRLMAYYLIENNKLESASSLDFYSSIHNYVPDPDRFIAFLGVDEAWTKLSVALRSSIAINKDVEVFSSLTSLAEDKEKSITSDRNPASRSSQQEKIDHLIEAISLRGNMLALLYKSAGLNPDMPPDMAEDPVLREKLMGEYRKVYSLVDELQKIPVPAGTQVSVDQPNYQMIERQRKKGDVEDKQAPEGAEEYRQFQEVNQGIGEIGIRGITTGGGKFGFIGTMPHLGMTAGVFGALSLTALIGTITSCVEVHKAWGGLTTAEKVVKVLGLSQELLNEASVATEAVSSGIEASSAPMHLLTAGSYWGTTATLATHVAGGLGVLAGTVKVVVASGQLIREGTSKYQVYKAKKTLEEKGEANLTEDEKVVLSFLKHEEKEVARRGCSASMDLAIGGAIALAGGLTMTGILAPIGAAVGVGAVIMDLGFKAINYGVKNANRKEAVDRYLDIDRRVDELMADQDFQTRNPKMKRKDVVEGFREEALASMGFASHNDCYRHICYQFATTLVRKVFYDKKDAQYPTYVRALKSLGLKVSDRDKLQGGEEPRPSVEAIVTRMMS